MTDPRSFTIPCSIGNSYCGKALCDLGASINLMSMSIFRQIGVGEVRPTIVTLQLADRSLAHLDEKIEDVLVRVDKFIFPTDFIVLDYEADMERLNKQDTQHALLCDRLHKFWEYSHQRDQAIKRALQRNFTKPIPPFLDFPMDILGPWIATASPEDMPFEEEFAKEFSQAHFFVI
ncbi:DNA-directed DNA polymerase [Melia azedarach]|uniref:DNA-directed DNA polymerase n=1 Tax=Melia azedarach TaxID=155640 RepID=A0ACC1X687_MELAZ|nr:DNA-directed DNA polymerase [Melia azedarach]